MEHFLVSTASKLDWTDNGRDGINFYLNKYLFFNSISRSWNASAWYSLNSCFMIGPSSVHLRAEGGGLLAPSQAAGFTI